MPGSLRLKDIGTPPAPVVPKDVGPPPVPDDPRQVAYARYGGPPTAPAPVVPKDVGPAPTPVVRVPVEPQPAPRLTDLGKRLWTEVGGGAGLSWLLGGTKIPAALGGTVATLDTLDTLLSKALMTPHGRTVLKSLTSAEGSITEDALATALAAKR